MSNRLGMPPAEKKLEDPTNNRICSSYEGLSSPRPGRRESWLTCVRSLTERRVLETQPKIDSVSISLSPVRTVRIKFYFHSGSLHRRINTVRVMHDSFSVHRDRLRHPKKGGDYCLNLSRTFDWKLRDKVIRFGRNNQYPLLGQPSSFMNSSSNEIRNDPYTTSHPCFCSLQSRNGLQGDTPLTEYQNLYFCRGRSSGIQFKDPETPVTVSPFNSVTWPNKIK